MENIKNLFKNRTSHIMGKYNKNAVMILLVEEDEEIKIVFEVRSSKLKHQPGDICLPGGRIEEGETPREAAIREAIEELNIKKEDMEYIGEMDYFVSPYGTILYPYIATLKKKEEIMVNSEEVDHIFTVPLRFFMENPPLVHQLEIAPQLKEDFPYHLIVGGKDYKFSRGKVKQYFYQYGTYVIWGFTAFIIKNFIEVVQGKKF